MRWFLTTNILKQMGLCGVLERGCFFPFLFFKLFLLAFFKLKMLRCQAFAFCKFERFQNLLGRAANEIKHRTWCIRILGFVVTDAEFKFFVG